jgi:hypothetical protein
MKFSMTGQEKCNLLIQVTAWTDLIVNEPFNTGDCIGRFNCK